MEVSVAVVMSLDGKLTRHREDGVKPWASPEEQQRFFALLADHDAEVLGSGTYDHIRGSMNLRADRLRIVLTSRPEQYKDDVVAAKLVFSSETPKQLIERLKSQNYKKLLVLGGPQMIYEFLEIKSVDKLYVTIEPLLFGQGKAIIPDLPVNIQLQLISHEVLSANGTLLLAYALIKEDITGTSAG